MPMKWRFAWALVLALVASPAFALGLGQIQVRSQYGEPLLAEIPIVSSDPAELRQLRARLASPETFARIGLEPPRGLVQDLQFNVALDASGRPVIRVTSTEPVDQPLLTFLIEADWGQGRLVREYSALLDAPDTVAAPAQPPIQAPVPDQGDRIVRPAVSAPPEAAVAVGPDAQPAAAEPDAVAGPESEAAPAAPAEEAMEADVAGLAQPVPGPPPAPAPAPVATAGAVPGEYTVQAGDTLSQIVQGMARDAEVTANQMMLALLRTHPEAFIGGNVNLVRAGAVLRVPGDGEPRRLSAADASAEVRAQVARWREMSAPRPQPGDAPVAQADQPGEAAAGEAVQAPQAAGPAADARLEIAPPASADGQQAGTRSGITAGGEGEMLRQELQETRESLAARDAEVEELKARLAELEEIQGQQQQLITLKDSELAAVQQRLAESNQQPGPTLADANQAAAGAPAPQDAGVGTPWLWIGLGVVLLVAAALAWVRLRRDGGSSAARRPASRSPTWHAGGGPAAAATATAAGSEAGRRPEPPDVQADRPEEPPEQSDDTVVRSPEQAPGPAMGPADYADPDALTGVGERLELAKAYVELGDIETARDLLQEVVDAGSAPESGEAERLLQDLARA